MLIKRYLISETNTPLDEISEEITGAKQVIMTMGYPNGKDAGKFLIIYALYQNQSREYLKESCGQII